MVVFQSPYKAERTPLRGVSSVRQCNLMRHEIVVFSNQSRISFEPKAKLYPQWKQKLQAMAETVWQFHGDGN